MTASGIETKPSGRIEAADIRVRPSHYWTWRLLGSGFSAEECAAIRGLDRESILDHALRAADDGWEVHAGWLLDPALLAAMQSVIGNGAPEQIRQFLPRLPGGTSYEEVQLFLKCRKEDAGG